MTTENGAAPPDTEGSAATRLAEGFASATPEERAAGAAEASGDSGTPAGGTETADPWRNVYDRIPEDQREAVAAGLTDLGDDVGWVTESFRYLHPDDRRVVAEVVSRIPSDPAGAGRELAAIAVALGWEPDGEATDAASAPAGEQFDEDQPLTRAEMEQYLEQQRAEDREQRDIERWTETLTREARDLGYDPDSEDAPEQVRYATLLNMASFTGGDLGKAHERVLAAEQAVIDRYIEAKRQEAERPGAPTAGGSPSTQTTEVVTTEDANEAATNRLAGHFGHAAV